MSDQLVLGVDDVCPSCFGTGVVTEHRVCGCRLDATADAPGAAVAGAPETSQQAAKDLTPRSGTLRYAALQAFMGAPTGLTDDGLARRMARPLNTVRPRRWELMHLGFVSDRGARRMSDANKPAVVWFATPQAREWWTAHHRAAA